jgi:hypothetical protein
MVVKKKAIVPPTSPPPKFTDFSHIDVPIGPVRMELAAIQRGGKEYMQLSDFLFMVYTAVKDDKANNTSD